MQLRIITKEEFSLTLSGNSKYCSENTKFEALNSKQILIFQILNVQNVKSARVSSHHRVFRVVDKVNITASPFLPFAVSSSIYSLPYTCCTIDV